MKGERGIHSTIMLYLVNTFWLCINGAIIIAITQTWSLIHMGKRVLSGHLTTSSTTKN